MEAPNAQIRIASILRTGASAKNKINMSQQIAVANDLQ